MKIIRRNKKSLKYTDFAVSKYTVILFRKIIDKYVEVERKQINIKDNKIRLNNKDYPFKSSLVAFADSNHNYYAFDYDKGHQLTFNILEFPTGKISIDDIDTYVNKGIISQIVAGLEKRKTDRSQWTMLILGIVIGLAIGFIIGNILSGSMGNLAQPVTNPNPTPFIIKP